MKRLVLHLALLVLALCGCDTGSKITQGSDCLSIASTYDHVAAIAMGEKEIVFDFYAADGTRWQGRFKAAWEYRDVGDLPRGAHMALELKTTWRDGRCEGVVVIHGPPPL